MPKTKYLMPDGELIEHETVPQWKTPWNHDTNFESDRFSTYTPEPSLTKQEFAEEADINTIIARVLKTGETPVILPEAFADASERTTYFEMASRIAEANITFYLLPARTRAQFANDPARWADAVVKATEQGDREALIAYGIHVPPKPPQVVEPETPPPEATPAREALRPAPEALKPGQAPDPKTETPKK